MQTTENGLYNIIPARSVNEVPRTAERVLTKVESLSALMKNDEASLPADIVQAIFRCLHLSTEEKKQVLHYLKANVKVSITEIRKYIANCFQEYEAIGNVLGPPPKQRYKLKLPRPAEITAGAAITDGGELGAGRGGRGAGSGRGGGGYRGRNRGPNKVDSPEGNTGVFPPEKKKYEKLPPSCHFCVAKKRPQNGNNMTACPWITAASKSDLLTTLPNLCLGCLQLKTSGEQKCPKKFKEEGGLYKNFCST